MGLGVRLPFVSPSWPPPPSPPPRPKLMPTLSSSWDTGSPMPITSLPQLSPFARLSLRLSPSDRDATPSPTAPPRPLLSARRSPEDPTCTDVEHVVPAVHAVYGKREAEADPQLLVGAPYVAHATTKVTTKHCVPGAPIVEDLTTDVTKCVPKSVCEDVTAEVLETVCGEAAAEEAVEEA